MPRQPKPWFWKARNAWYVQVGGKQHKLHENKKEAEREWHRIMAAEGLLDSRQRQAMTVADACEAYLSQSQHLRENTLILLERMLSRFASSPFGTRRLPDVAPDQVVAWITAQDFTDNGRCRSDGNASRHLMLRHIKTIFKWARDSGISDINQFARLPNPWKVLPRPRAMSLDEYVAVMSRNRVSDEFKEVVEFVWRTGIRPGELARLERRHLDRTAPVAHFQPTEHKTGTKTGRQRNVYFPPDLWERLQTYAEARPTGPLMRRANGKPWTAKAISSLWNQLKHSMGLECVLYQARHSFATDMLAKGHSPDVVAEMLGHVRPDVLFSVYNHPAVAKIQAALEATQVEAADQATKIQAKVKERRQGQVEKRRARNARSYQKQKERRVSLDSSDT
jgi:integrase